MVEIASISRITTTAANRVSGTVRLSLKNHAAWAQTRSKGPHKNRTEGKPARAPGPAPGGRPGSGEPSGFYKNPPRGGPSPLRGAQNSPAGGGPTPCTGPRRV